MTARFKPDSTYLCTGINRFTDDAGEFIPGNKYETDESGLIICEDGKEWNNAHWADFEEVVGSNSFHANSFYRCTEIKRPEDDAGEFTPGGVYRTNESGMIVDTRGFPWVNVSWMLFEEVSSSHQIKPEPLRMRRKANALYRCIWIKDTALDEGEFIPGNTYETDEAGWIIDENGDDWARAPWVDFEEVEAGPPIEVRKPGDPRFPVGIFGNVMMGYPTENAENAENDLQNPNWYNSMTIEPKDFIMANAMEWWRGNTVKYTARAGKKPYEGKTLEESEIIDLKKAKRMIEMRLDEIEGE